MCTYKGEKMTFDRIIDNLREKYKVVEWSIGQEKREVSRFSLYQEGMKCDDPACIYIGMEGMSQGIEAAPLYGILQPVAMAGAVNILSDLFFRQKSIEERYEELEVNEYYKLSLAELINKAALFLDRSLVLTDLSFRVHGYSTSVAITDPIWKENIARGYCSYDFISAVSRLLPKNMDENSREAFFVDCPLSTELRISSRLILNGEPVGYLIMLDNNKGIEPYHLDYLPKIAELLVVSLVYNPESKNCFLDARGNVFLEMLKALKDGNTNQVTSLNEYPDFPEKLRVIRVKMNQLSRNDIFYGTRAFKDLFPGGRIFPFENDIVGVISSDRMEKLNEDEPDILKHVREIGVSEEFCRMKDFIRAYTQAEEACKLAVMANSDEKLKMFDDYDFLKVLEFTI